jgi:alkanesulfonate monooxygenase SsuD/methylene tetrahydromethanopterin reductase-like flavin-dependent oxidoreductase (luciferase family)
MFKMLHVALEKAWDEVEPHLRNHMIRHVERTKLKPAQAAKMDLSVPALGELRTSGRGPNGPPAIGSPDEVIGYLEQHLRTTRLTEIRFTPGSVGMDRDAARRSLELFAKEVRPHFRKT